MTLTIEDIRKTAQIAVHILRDAGISCCLVGSAASSEHGITRVPNDVDILILSGDANVEDIKEMIPQRHSNFSLARPPHNSQATYHVLWYTLPLPTTPNSPPKTCRVDIFVPGVISLPWVPPEYVVHSRGSGLPLIPFLAALLHKVLAWVAHGKSSTQHGQYKQIVDVGDIGELLELAVSTYKPNLAEEKWLPTWFIDAAMDGVAQYISIYPITAHIWMQIGLGPQTFGNPPEIDTP